MTPRAGLVERPSPLIRLRGLQDLLGARSLHAKREQDLATGYGGSKVRGLDVLLGQLGARGVDAVVTSALSGSSYLAALAYHARTLGISCTAWVHPQPATAWAQRNVAIARTAGCHVRLAEPGASLRSTGALLRGTERELRDQGFSPCVLPFAGAGPAAAVGHVAAVAELRAQLAECGEPDAGVIVIAVASGTMAAGLLVGLELAAVRTRLLGVRVTSAQQSSASAVADTIGMMAATLGGTYGSVPNVRRAMSRLELIDGTGGHRFGLPTPAAESARALAGSTDAIDLEPIYTAKAFAAFAARARGTTEPLVFWHSADCRKFEPIPCAADRALFV